MKEDKDLQLIMRRQSALVELIKEHSGGNQSEFAKLIGRSQNAVTRWLSKEYGTPKHRGIKPENCRAMEVQFKKPKYWMDNYGRKPETESSAIKEVMASYLDRLSPEGKLEVLEAARDALHREQQLQKT